MTPILLHYYYYEQQSAVESTGTTIKHNTCDMDTCMENNIHYIHCAKYLTLSTALTSAPDLISDSTMSTLLFLLAAACSGVNCCYNSTQDM